VPPLPYLTGLPTNATPPPPLPASPPRPPPALQKDTSCLPLSPPPVPRPSPLQQLVQQGARAALPRPLAK